MYKIYILSSFFISHLDVGMGGGVILCLYFITCFRAFWTLLWCWWCWGGRNRYLGNYRQLSNGIYKRGDENIWIHLNPNMLLIWIYSYIRIFATHWYIFMNKYYSVFRICKISWINNIWYSVFRDFYEQILFSIWYSENFHEQILFGIQKCFMHEYYSVFGFRKLFMNEYIRYPVF